MSADTKYRIRATDETGPATRSAKAGFESAATAARTLESALGLIGISLGVGSILSAADAFIKEAGAIKDGADAAGIAAEQLQRLQYAAKMTGVEAQGLGTALRIMEKNLSEGDKSFQQLGLSASALKAQSPDEAFLTIADAVAGLRSEYEQTEISMKIFGKSGGELVPLMKAGAAAIREMGDRGEQTGNILSNEAVDGLDSLGDELDSVKGSLNSTFAEILVSTGPAFLKFLQDAAVNTQFLYYNFESMLQGVFQSNAWLFEQAQKLPFGNAWKKQLGESAEYAKSQVAAIEAALRRVEEHPLAFDRPETPKATGPSNRTGQLRDVEAAAKAAKQAEKELADLQRSAEAITSDVATAQDRYNASLELAGKLVFQGLISMDTFDKYVDKVTRDLEEATKGLYDWGKSLDLVGSRLRRIVEPPKKALGEWDEFWATIQLSAAQALEYTSQAFTDALFDMENGLEHLRDFATDVLRQIANALIYKNITGPILGSLGLDIGELAGKRAWGGHVSALQPYLVGERGPELFVPGASGTIVPAGAFGGGVTLNYSPVIQAIDTRSGLEFLAGHARVIGALVQREAQRNGQKGPFG